MTYLRCFFVTAELLTQMALVASSKCFKAIEDSLVAMKQGKAGLASVLLGSIKQDGVRMKEKSLLLHFQLKKEKKIHQETVEELTRQVYSLSKQEMELRSRKQSLVNRKSSLVAQKESFVRRWRLASKTYQEAVEKRREAERKYNEFKYLWWIPIVGWFLTLREIIQGNLEKAHEAYREMLRNEAYMEAGDFDIRWANSTVLKVIDDHCKFISIN